MKLGLLISAFIVLAFVALVFFQAGGPATPPTNATRPAALQRHGIPDGTPPLVALGPASAQPGSADAAATAALDFFLENASSFLGDPSDTLVDEWSAKLIAAAQAGRLSDGLLDQGAKLEPGSPGKYHDALVAMPSVVGQRALALFESGKQARALEVMDALFWWGQQGFTHHLRLRTRFHSQYNMAVAHNYLLQWSGDDRKPALDAWAKVLGAMDEYWQRKSELLLVLSPNIGDVARLATEDQDPTFRLEATLKLGVLQHNPKTTGNARVIRSALAAAAKDADPRVVAAAAAAQAMTVEQIHKMR